MIEEELLVELAKIVGKEEEIRKLTELGLRGSINWEHGLRKRIRLLKGMDYETVLCRCQKFTLKPGAKEAISLFKSAGFHTAIITGGFGLQARPVCVALGIDYLACNELVFQQGKLVGIKINVSTNKDSWLQFLADFCGSKITAAFGDGENDRKMVEAAVFGRILKPEDSLLEEAKRVIEVLSSAPRTTF